MVTVGREDCIALCFVLEENEWSDVVLVSD